MTTQELINIAKEKGLKVANVKDLGIVVYDFFDFNKVVKFAKEYKLEDNIHVIRKEDDNLEEVECVVYSDDYVGLDYGFNLLEQYKNDKGEVIQFFKGDAEDFQEYEIDEIVEWMKEEEKSEKEIERVLAERNEVKAKIENLSDGEFISKSCNGDFTDVLPKYLAKMELGRNVEEYVAVVLEYEQ